MTSCIEITPLTVIMAEWLMLSLVSVAHVVEWDLQPACVWRQSSLYNLKWITSMVANPDPKSVCHYPGCVAMVYRDKQWQTQATITSGRDNDGFPEDSANSEMQTANVDLALHGFSMEIVQIAAKSVSVTTKAIEI